MSAAMPTELARVKAIFQQRAIVAATGIVPPANVGIEPVTITLPRVSPDAPASLRDHGPVEPQPDPSGTERRSGLPEGGK